MRSLWICALLLGLTTGCTGGGSSSSSNLPPLTESPILDPSSPSDGNLSDEFTKPEKAQQKVAEIIEQLNAAPEYSINDEDLALLSEEGILSENNELKGWVK